MKKLIYSLFAFLCLAACEDPITDNIVEDPKDEKPAAEISLDMTSVNFTSEGGTQAVTFTSTADWTADSEERLPPGFRGCGRSLPGWH